jgi:hypothetical protein
MFSNILITYNTLHTKTFEALYTQVLSLRDIKDGTHVRMRNKLFGVIKKYVDKHLKQFEYDGLEVKIHFLPSIEIESAQIDLNIRTNDLSKLKSIFIETVDSILSDHFYRLIDESHWTTREEDFRLEKSFDRTPFIAVEAKQAISSWNIGLTGDGPYTREEMTSLLRRCGVFNYSIRPRANNVLIVGRKKYDNVRLKKFRSNSPIKYGRVFTQESFLKFLMFGEDYDANETIKNVIKHQGVEYLKRLTGQEFPWPSIKYDSKGIKRLVAIEWSDESELRRLTGYSVAGELTTMRLRRAQLRKGVGLLGLESVSRHIARQLRQRLTRTDVDYENALEKWQDDLDWLFKTYYLKRNQTFPWPQ